MSALIHALTRSIYNLKLALPSDNIPPPCLVHGSRKWKSGHYHMCNVTNNSNGAQEFKVANLDYLLNCLQSL
jgi:hypothetical protein